MDSLKIADFLLAGLSSGLQSRGQAVLVISGGSSPVPVFEVLSQAEFPWDKVVITLVDERAVPSDHKDSNHRLASQHLLQDKAAKAHFIPLFNNPDAALQIGTEMDVALLGMGTDGHFASLFPAMIGDDDAFSPDAMPQIITTAPMGAPIHPRISMNMAMIAQIKHHCLLLPSAEKVAIFESAKSDKMLPMHYLQNVLGDDLVLFS